MKKKLVLLLSGIFLTVAANASVYLRYQNKDSKTYTFEVKIAGSTKTVEFGSSRTSSVTIQGGSEKVEVKTDCGWVTLEDDDEIIIKDGCITID